MSDVNPKELMIDIQGKDYLPVAARVLWARREHPDWAIVTEAVTIADGTYMKATVVADGSILATAHKMVDPTRRGPGAKYPVESAETGAVGRALGLCGYGTLAGDLDEGDELADTPVERPAKRPATYIPDEPPPTYEEPPATVAFEDAGGRPTTDKGWSAQIAAFANDPPALIALLPDIDAEGNGNRRHAALKKWAEAVGLNGTPEQIAEAGRMVKAWPADKKSRGELLTILTGYFERAKGGAL